jgi:cell division protein FtsW
MKSTEKNPPGDQARDVFVTTVFVLTALGVVMVFSSSAFHRLADGDPYYFLRRQLAWVLIGTLAGVFFYQLDYRLLRQYHGYSMAIVIVLLALVLVPQLGRSVNGSRRWLPLGGGLQVQPSELAKLATMIFVAGFLANDPSRLRRFWKGFVPVCLVIALAFGLVLVEPDFGTSLFVLVLGFSLVVLAGMRWRYLLASVVLFAPVLTIFIHVRRDQIAHRILGFLDPEQVYQLRHSLVALGSGGMFGRGLGAGAQKLRFLPEAHTDFVLAILGEELGFLGCAGVVLLFLTLLWSATRMVLRTQDLFGFLLGAGITLSLCFQAVLNIAVISASAPTKGIALPFLTFGGSGLCMTLAQVGVLLSIDRVRREGASVPVARKNRFRREPVLKTVIN